MLLCRRKTLDLIGPAKKDDHVRIKRMTILYVPRHIIKSRVTLLMEVVLGTSQESKAVTHKQIVKVASQRFREKGLGGVGLADIMKEAGTSIGGFYKHFDSKDDLICEALQVAFSDYNVIGQSENLSDDIEKYLSVEHRDAAEAGCATGALLGDLVHANAPVKKVYTLQVQKSLSLLSSRLDNGNEARGRADALLLMCALVGAINLARTVDEPALSHEFLVTVRARLSEVLISSTLVATKRRHGKPSVKSVRKFPVKAKPNGR